jgi:hypothetical protein
MTAQGDLERADPGPSMGMYLISFYQSSTDLERCTDIQRDEQVPGKTRQDAKTTAGEHSAIVAAWMQRLQTLTLIVSHCSVTLVST